MGQATQGSPDAAQILLERLGQLTVGEGIAYDRMVLFPLFPEGNGPQDALNYRTIAEAIADGSLKVTERPSASVPTLTLENTGQTMVLIFDGEEIIGGKQNRVVNTTFLVAAGTKMDLPVTCVERGRWHRTSETFASGESGYYALRMAKHRQVTDSLRRSGRPTADQGQIWAEVSMRERLTGSHSLTGAMHEIYKTRDTDLGAYQEHFAYVPGALGMLVALYGRMAGGDLFDQPGTARSLWQKLVRSYALDALAGTPGETIPRAEAEELLERARRARCEVYPSLALGQEVRFEGDGLVGGGLVYQERSVHVNLFCTGGRDKEQDGRGLRVRGRGFAQWRQALERQAELEEVEEVEELIEVRQRV